MKYFTIVLLLYASSFASKSNGLRLNKLSGEESAAAEADIDALMDKYDEKEKSAKESSDRKKN